MLRCVEPHLLRGDVKRDSPEVDLLVVINAGQDKEYPRTPSSSRSQSPQPEYDRPLVLLDNLTAPVGEDDELFRAHLDTEEEGDGESDCCEY